MARRLSPERLIEAANAGDADAMLHLSKYHRREKHTDVADLWLRKAAEAGNPEAMLGLSKRIWDGFSWPDLKTPEERRESEQWLRDAAAAEYPPAMMTLGVRIVRGQLKDPPSEGRVWIRKAAQRGDYSAMLWMSRLAEQRRDWVAARSWLVKAGAPIPDYLQDD